MLSHIMFKIDPKKYQKNCNLEKSASLVRFAHSFCSKIFKGVKIGETHNTERSNVQAFCLKWNFYYLPTLATLLLTSSPEANLPFSKDSPSYVRFLGVVSSSVKIKYYKATALLTITTGCVLFFRRLQRQQIGTRQYSWLKLLPRQLYKLYMKNYRHLFPMTRLSSLSMIKSMANEKLIFLSAKIG